MVKKIIQPFKISKMSAENVYCRNGKIQTDADIDQQIIKVKLLWVVQTQNRLVKAKYT